MLRVAGGWSGAPPPGVPTPGNRTFSQSVGGLSQPSTPLDINEFPVLGGPPQTNPAAAWSRLNTQSPSNRGLPQQQQQQPPPSSQHAQHLQPPQSQHDGFPGGQKDVYAGMDDYRIGGGGGQVQGQNQSQGGQLQGEDFPALPRTQTGSLGGGLGDGSLNSMGQRQGMASRLTPQLDGMMGQQQAGTPSGDVEKKTILKPGIINGAPGLSSNPSSTLPLGAQQQQPSRPSPAPGLTHPSQQQQQTQQSLGAKVGTTNGDSPAQSQFGGPSHSVSEDERFSLTGLFSAMRSDAGEGTSLAKGQDLMMLGLDINSQEPLWPTFASPFTELEATAVEPEFHLPNCYTVVNTQPVHSKIGSFSDETLFFIFYTMPRDIMQEVVVAELAARNWRYHMCHRLWMTKDPTAQVEQFSETAERGFYVFFDPTTWERVKKEIVLEYSHLDPRTTGTYIGGINTGVGPLAGLGA
ncbi:hypothetical protein FN846DRAFT_913661 [Sphaerosporella brunnea]|uniref:NOT2/NOT3/NOT5 C-terminal domain-containing protein n=1 Tax=Sphaerosporella brunnea TaxID=1250544 RepID=A0A5J5EDS2_9PEZI|nr:hypothetical protein FN846DRAFT_913661 [Sphaerosporella brunnea]